MGLGQCQRFQMDNNTQKNTGETNKSREKERMKERAKERKLDVTPTNEWFINKIILRFDIKGEIRFVSREICHKY